MSTGRYCDVQISPDCPSRPPYHGVFSELADDWDTFTGARMKRDRTTGKRYNEAVTQDCCPACTVARESHYKPPEPEPERKAIPGKVVDPDEYQRYIDWLEKENLDTPITTPEPEPEPGT